MSLHTRNMVIWVGVLALGLALAVVASRAWRTDSPAGLGGLSPTGADEPITPEGSPDSSSPERLAVVSEASETPRGLSIRGKVLLFAGEPVGGSRVLSTGEHSTEADDQGRFELAGLAPGEYWLQAESPGMASHPAAPVRLFDRDVEDLQLFLEQGLYLRGIVRDAAGEAIDGASITGRVARRDSAPDWRFVSSSPYDSPLRAETDPRGRFELGPLPSCTVEVTASCEGFVGSGRAYPSHLGEVEITLASLPCVFGQVLGRESGVPQRVEQVSVLVSTRDMDGPWVPMNDPSGLVAGSGDEGSFRLWPRTHRPIRLVAVGADFAPVASEPVRLTREDVGPLVLFAKPGVLLRGRVVAPDGSAVPRAAVAITPVAPPEEAAAPRLTSAAETDGGGAFQVRVGETRVCELVVRAEGYLEHREEVAATEEGIRIELTSSASLVGRLEPSGAGVLPEFWVRLRRPGETAAAIPTRRTVGPRFHFPTVPIGEYEVQLFNAPPRGTDAPALAAATVVLRAGAPGSVTLSASGTGGVHGQLTVDGEAAPYRQITLRNEMGETRAECTTDRQGRFAFGWLTAGGYALDVGLDPRTPTCLRRGFQVTVGESLEVDLDLAVAALRGRVLHEDDRRPVRGAQVVVERVEAGPGERFEVTRLRTDADGSFQCSDLASGRVLISVVAPFLTNVERFEADLNPGSQNELGELLMRPGGSLDIKLRSRARRPGSPDEFVITLTPGDEAIEPREVRRLGFGSIRADGLPPGQIEVQVRRATGETVATRTSWVTAQRVETILLDLE